MDITRIETSKFLKLKKWHLTLYKNNLQKKKEGARDGERQKTKKQKNSSKSCVNK